MCSCPQDSTLRETKTPPAGCAWGRPEGGCQYWGVWRRHPPVLSRRTPLTEVPIAQCQPHFDLAVQAELVKHLAHIALDRIRRQLELEGDLAVGVAQAGQGGNILFARREGQPALPEVGMLFAAHQPLRQQVGLDLAGRAFFPPGDVEQEGAEVLIQLKGAVL